MKLYTVVAAGSLAVLAPGITSAQPVHPVSGTSTTVKVRKEPPYYTGKLGAASGPIAILPVASTAANPDLPSDWVPLAELRRLAEAMTLELPAEPLALGRPIEADLAAHIGPRVYFGCSYDEADGSCLATERNNVLASSTATKAWRQALQAAATARDADRVLVLEIGIAPQWIRQRNLKGTKEIRLGTGSTQPLPWLTSLDTPVWVVQVRGTAVDGEGRVERAGAEGIWALRTPFSTSAYAGQKILSPADVDYVRTELRRDDLPGAPLSWQAALRRLIHQLGGPAEAPVESTG